MELNSGNQQAATTSLELELMGNADAFPGGRAGVLGVLALGCAGLSLVVGGIELVFDGGLRGAVILALMTLPLPALVCASLWRAIVARPNVLISDRGVVLSLPEVKLRPIVVKPIQRGIWLEWRQRFIPLGAIRQAELTTRGVRVQCRDGMHVDLETWRHGLPDLPGPSADPALMPPRLRKAVNEQRELLLGLQRRLDVT